MAGRMLAKLSKEYDLTIEKIDVTRHPLRTIQAGITMIPTIKTGEDRLSGLVLSETRIRAFLA